MSSSRTLDRPEPSAIAGEACSEPGLRCDFESYDGYTRCAGSMWERCTPARFREHCPAMPPTAGERCCVIVIGTTNTDNEDCPYNDGSVWRCEADQWTLQP